MAADESKIPQDPTPIVGAETDIARLSHAPPKPAHEQTADEDRDSVDWHALAADERFKNLLRAKRRFILPATIFFIVYYFALPVSVGYFPQLMQQQVWGAVNLAYLFGLSQFFVAWIIAALYIRAAARFDKMAEELVGNQSKQQ